MPTPVATQAPAQDVDSEDVNMESAKKNDAVESAEGKIMTIGIQDENGGFGVRAIVGIIVCVIVAIGAVTAYFVMKKKK